MNEYRICIHIKHTWRCKALIGLVRDRDSKTSLLGNWKTYKHGGKRWLVSAIAWQPLVGKGKGTQEKDGRDVNPAVIPTSQVGQCETFGLRKGGTAPGKWRAGCTEGRSPTRGRIPWMSRTFMASKRLMPPSPPRTLLGKGGWREHWRLHSSACGYRDWILLHISIYSSICSFLHPMCLRGRVSRSWGSAGYMNYHVV